MNSEFWNSFRLLQRITSLSQKPENFGQNFFQGIEPPLGEGQKFILEGGYEPTRPAAPHEWDGGSP